MNSNWKKGPELLRKKTLARPFLAKLRRAPISRGLFGAEQPTQVVTVTRRGEMGRLSFYDRTGLSSRQFLQFWTDIRPDCRRPSNIT
jgi:hypothetical protein